MEAKYNSINVFLINTTVFGCVVVVMNLITWYGALRLHVEKIGNWPQALSGLTVLCYFAVVGWAVWKLHDAMKSDS